MASRQAPPPRKGMPAVELDEGEFKRRFRSQFDDPAFDPLQAELDRYIGYWQPYATSHEALDQDLEIQEEVRNAARPLLEAVQARRAGRLVSAGEDLEPPRQK